MKMGEGFKQKTAKEWWETNVETNERIINLVISYLRKVSLVVDRCVSVGQWEGVNHLDRIVASDDASVLNFDIGGGMCEFAFRVTAGALVALVLTAHLKLQPARVLYVKQSGGIHPFTKGPYIFINFVLYSCVCQLGCVYFRVHRLFGNPQIK